MRAVLSILLVLTALVSGGAHAEAGTFPGGIIALDGRPAPPLKLEDMDGVPFDLGESHGHWVFVHFWASWCGPCRREMPTIQRMVDLLRDTSLEVVLVNTAETEDEVFSFLGIVAPELRTLMDHDGLVTERWQPRGLPASFLVDPQGQLRYLALGGRTWDSRAYLGFLRGLVAEEKHQSRPAAPSVPTELLAKASGGSTWSGSGY